jgi:hypothetical protein
MFLSYLTIAGVTTHVATRFWSLVKAIYLRHPFQWPMAGLDKKEIFCALAKTLPIATDVACFLSTQNAGS